MDSMLHCHRQAPRQGLRSPPAPPEARSGGLAPRSGRARPARRHGLRCLAASKSAASRRRLGDSDLEVSECCLGTMTWGVQNSEEEAHEQLSYALERGVNFLDTAEIYPVPPSKETKHRTEEYIGSWLKKNRDRQGDYIIATKVAGFGNDYLREGGKTRITPQQIATAVEGSLQRMGIETIDLLQIHWPDRYVPLFGAAAYDPANEREDDVPFEEQLRGLEAVVKAGKVRYVGVSNETTYGVGRFCQLAASAGLPKIVSIQNSYSLLVRTAFETDLLEACAPRQHNIGLLAYSPLAGGALTGKYMAAQPDPKARFNFFPGYMERYTKSLAKQAIAGYAEAAKKHHLTPTQLALGWCSAQKHVASSIIGATSVKQLKENIDAFEVELSEEALEDINRVYLRYRDPTTKPIEE